MNSVDEVYESLAAELARLSGRSGVLDRAEARHRLSNRRQEAARAKSLLAWSGPPPAASLVVELRRVPPIAPWHPRVASPERRLFGLALAGLTLLLLTALFRFWPPDPSDNPASAASVDLLTSLPATSAGTPPQSSTSSQLAPSMWVFSDSQGDDAAARISADLARWISPGQGQRIEAVKSTGWADALSHAQAPGHLAIVRYDALRAASAERPNGSAALRVVAPLYREDIQLLVRADSPLRFMHDIRGRRMNVGSADSSRALTAGALYASLFGTAPAPQQLDTQGEAAGLADLLAGRVDVVVHVGAHDANGISGQLPGSGERLKLLSLDTTNAIDRKALQRFLPSRVSAVGTDAVSSQDSMTTLAVMSFLVSSDTDGAASRDRLQRLARELCQRIDVLRDQGDSLWREVDFSTRLDVGFPYDESAAHELGQCPKDATSTTPGPGRRESMTVPQPSRRSLP